MKSVLEIFIITSIRAGFPHGALATPLLLDLFSSDQFTTSLLFTITTDFSGDKAILALNFDSDMAANLLQCFLELK